MVCCVNGRRQLLVFSLAVYLLLISEGGLFSFSSFSLFQPLGLRMGKTEQFSLEPCVFTVPISVSLLTAKHLSECSIKQAFYTQEHYTSHNPFCPCGSKRAR